MADNSILDKALGFISSVQEARKEGRDEFMRTILPEVLQPEELKQAEAKPTKEEGPKTLHAPKYDRRMKFNTALERSKHEASKEEPVWLKEAASPEELQRRQAVNLIMLEYLNNPNASTKKRDGTSVIDLQQLPEEHQAQIQKAFKGLRFAPKQASDPAFDFAGVTGREGVITVEDELERTPPLPIEEPLEYEVGNKPVMQKESAIDLPVDNGIFSVAEPTASEKALPIVGGLSAGILPLTGAFFNPNPSLKSLGVAGLASAGFGLGTYGLLRHRQNKHREQAQKFVDRLNAVARSPMEDFARAEIENVNKTAAYPGDESFTQRHPWVLPAGLGILGAAAGAIPAGRLGGRHAVKTMTKGYNKQLADLGADSMAATSAYGRASADPVITKEELRQFVDAARKAETRFADAVAAPPNLDFHRAVGRVGGGTLGGLTGGSLGVLGGLAANNPQLWEQ